MRLRIGIALALLLFTGWSSAQIAEFDFYPSFRRWWFALPPDQNKPFEAVVERYQHKLATEGVDASEITRRLNLIRTRRPELETDFWNRFFTVDPPAFNTAPNAFLVSVVTGRRPGRALDVGMGEGRNTIYLAQQGWDVTGFDPADKAVALAGKRAADLGLKIHTQVVLDRNFEFGHAQWDLILLSWMPPNEPTRIVEALRPGGIVVFEGPEFWFPRNGLLKTFEALRVLRYEDEVRRGDYFQKDMPVVRLLAERVGDNP